MKVSVSRDALQSALALVSLASSAKHDLLKISTDGCSLCLRTFDCVRSARAKAPATIENDGCVFVSFRLLGKLVKSGVSSAVNFTLNQAKTQLIVAMGDGTYRIPLQAEAAFPAVFNDEAADGKSEVSTFDPEELVRAIKAVLPAAEKDPAALLSSVNLSKWPDGMPAVVATNRKHLFKISLNVPIGITTMTIPAAATKGFFAVAEGRKSLTLRSSPAALLMESEAGEFATLLEHAKYPDCSVVMKPLATARRFFTAKREDLLGAVARAAILHQGGEKISFLLNSQRREDGTTLLVVKNSNTALQMNSNEEFVLANEDSSFANLTIAINPLFLQSALSAEVLDEVEFWVPAGTEDNCQTGSPIFMRSEKSGFQAVIMPILHNA
jgi:DNA polymerase III sliding clamp (beta) subunit (PCNA family)